jgi:polysaccharide export outer membrane protein
VPFGAGTAIAYPSSDLRREHGVKVRRNGSFRVNPHLAWGALLVLGLLGLTLLIPVDGDASLGGYRIGPGDVLRVTVYGHEDLNRVSVVSSDGRMPFPLVGEVQAAGLTPTELEASLRQLLGKDYLVDPQVTVAVQEYRSQKVFVLGEAEKPGTYPLTGRSTLLDVLSQAGGPNKAAGRQVVVVRFPKSEGPVTPGTAGSTMFRLNLKKLLDGDASENIVLESGDTIHIPKQTNFFVLGEVKRPGAFALEKDTSALEAITLAGGFTERAAPAVAKVLRRRADGNQESIVIDLGGTDPRAREFLLAEGDTILVPTGNSFYVMGEVRKPGAYQLEQAATAIEGVALAGGFTEKAAPNRTKIIRTHRDGRQETIVVDLNEVIKRGRKDKDVPLSANDVIVVPESYF